MLIKKLLTILLFIGLFIPALNAQVIQYDELRVAKIDVIPENLLSTMSFDPQIIRAKLQTKVGNYFSQNEFDRDLKCLAEEYERIEPVFQVINNELYITIRLWIKPAIHSITFCGNEHFKEKKLRKVLEIEENCIYDREEFIRGLNKLKALYVKKGFFESCLDFSIHPIEGCNQVDIIISIEEGRAGRIQEIEFCGFDPCEESDILEMLVTKKYNLLLSWYTGTGNYHPDMIEHDQMVILDYLQNRGYADAVVTICIDESCRNDRIIVRICAEKGVYYSVGNLTICGNCLFDEAAIRDKLLFCSGGVFSPAQVRDTVIAVKELYGACGYIDASVDVQLSLREDCPIYDLNFSIEEGEQFYVGMIHVFGNYCTVNKVILHESLLCPGEVFDIRKLEGTETRLSNTGYFQTVNVYAVRSSDECDSDGPHYRDVYIEVEEADTGNIGIFFGFSSLNSLFGGIELTEQNFNIAGIPYLLQRGPRVLRGGGEFFHVKADIGNRQTSYLLQWTKPFFMDTPWIVGFDLERNNNRAYSRSYEVKTYGGNVHATYIWNDFLKHDIFYRARHTSISIDDKDNAQLIQQAQNTGFVSAVGTAFIYDSTNHPRRPSCGVRSRLVYELAGVGGNFQFMKFGYFNSYYYPVCKRGVFKFRADAQFIHTYGHTVPTGLPLSERLFLGGETTVRGYRPFIIGPKFGSGEPSGGVSCYLISEEYQHNLLRAPCLDAFFFVDAGYVSLSEFSVGRPAASVGLGIRVELMPNVPMTFGMGWPIHPFETFKGVRINNAQRFFFAMGAQF